MHAKDVTMFGGDGSTVATVQNRRCNELVCSADILSLNTGSNFLGKQFPLLLFRLGARF